MTFFSVIILIKSFANKYENKHYYNIFLEKGSYKDKWMFAYYKCYAMIELTCLKILMLIKKAHQKGVTFVTIVIIQSRT